MEGRNVTTPWLKFSPVTPFANGPYQEALFQVFLEDCQFITSPNAA